MGWRAGLFVEGLAKTARSVGIYQIPISASSEDASGHMQISITL